MRETGQRRVLKRNRDRRRDSVNQPITLINVNETLAKKATDIYLRYSNAWETKKHTPALDKAAQAVVNLKIVTETPELKNSQAELQPRLERIIEAFNVESGTFPEGFNTETGKYE